jgi:hypothetical protein
LDLAKLMQGKHRAFHAAPVNSRMLPVTGVANRVSIRRTLVAKEETAVASTARSVGRPKTAVPNVPRAVPVRLALGVKLARKVLPEQETTMMRHNVNNVNWAKQRRLKEPLNAMIVMLEHLAKPKVSVQHARLVFIRTTKVK